VWKTTRDFDLAFSGGGTDVGRNEVEAHGWGALYTGNPDWYSSGQLPQAGDSLTASKFERTTQYTAAGSQKTHELHKNDYSGTYWATVYDNRNLAPHHNTYRDNEVLNQPTKAITAKEPTRPRAAG
jgi:hypothetical protein